MTGKVKEERADRSNDISQGGQLVCWPPLLQFRSAGQITASTPQLESGIELAGPKSRRGFSLMQCSLIKRRDERLDGNVRGWLIW